MSWQIACFSDVCWLSVTILPNFRHKTYNEQGLLLCDSDEHDCLRELHFEKSYHTIRNEKPILVHYKARLTQPEGGWVVDFVTGKDVHNGDFVLG